MVNPMLPIWWDNGANDFGILNRHSNPPSWTWPTIAEALVRGASEAVPIDNERKQPAPAAQNIIWKLNERAGMLFYTLSESAPVTMRLFTLQGKTIATLVHAVQPAGNHTITLPQGVLSSGSYIMELRLEDNIICKKTVLSR